jgi:hypothetical protein
MALASLGLFRNQAKVETAVHKRRRAPTAWRCEPEPGQHAPRRLQAFTLTWKEKDGRHV